MMERLTNKNYNGGAYVYENELEESPFTHENKGVYYGNAIDRLAAYEDTGLTPGDIKDLQALCEKGGLAKYVDLIVQAKRQMGKDNERGIEQDERIEQLEDELTEYRQAKTDGRLVVLPCKVGDTAYDPYPEGIDEGVIHHICIIVESDIGVFSPDDFGKTVFLTRAEAEAALKGE